MIFYRMIFYLTYHIFIMSIIQFYHNLFQQNFKVNIVHITKTQLKHHHLRSYYILHIREIRRQKNSIFLNITKVYFILILIVHLYDS